MTCNIDKSVLQSVVDNIRNTPHSVMKARLDIAESSTLAATINDIMEHKMSIKFNNSIKIYDTDNKTILGNGDTAFHKVKGKKTANIKIKERLENGKTYLMELSVKQNDKTIRYFTRVI